VRLQEALNKAGVPNQLVTIPGGKHGGFNHEQTLKAYSAIRDFLSKHNLVQQDQAAAATEKKPLQ
jgi:dipeptidyl aminopeptidase/acylaminoacyl peptidase